jgi:hypothetical protein
MPFQDVARAMYDFARTSDPHRIAAARHISDRVSMVRQRPLSYGARS